MGFPLPGSGSVTENPGGATVGTSGDVDFFLLDDTGAWTAETIAGAYGSSLTIDADGVWSYTADSSHPAIAALDTGDTLTEVFTVTATSGTTTVTITINGTDTTACFTRGTLIETPRGPRPVEDLVRGDEVLTADNGPQRIRWIGSKRVADGHDADFQALRPIRILKDSLGPGVPARDISVSPMHRLVLSSPDTRLLFGQDQVFCAARLLVNGQTIYCEEVDAVEYFHILFDRHEVLDAHGCLSESFYPGTVGLSAFDQQVCDEVLTLFSELKALPDSFGPSARPVLKRHEGDLMQGLFRPADDLRRRLARAT